MSPHLPVLYRVFRAIAAWLAYRDLRSVQGIDHVPTTGGFILAANHVSWLDPVYLTSALHKRAQQRILFIAATRKHRWSQAIIPIDPKNKPLCLEIAEKHLNRGEVVGIFPTGDQRSLSTSDEHLRTGVARLALRSGFPIVPALLSNVTSGHTWKSLVAYLVKPSSIDITFGEPFRLQPIPHPSPEMLHAKTLEVFSRIQGLAAPE